MEKVEYFIISPSTKLFGGIKVNKDTEFKDVYNEDKSVKQSLKDLVLTTEIINKERVDYNGAVKTTENTKLVQEIPEGLVLIYGEDTGYIIPPYKMIKIEEAVEMLEKANEITKPIEEAQEKYLQN